MGHNALGAKSHISSKRHFDNCCGTNAGLYDTRRIQDYHLELIVVYLGVFFLGWIQTASDLTLVSVIALITDFNYSLKPMQCYRKSFMYRWSSDSPSDNM